MIRVYFVVFVGDQTFEVMYMRVHFQASDTCVPGEIELIINVTCVFM